MTSRIKLAARSRVTSTLIASFRSYVKRRSRCLTGFAVLSKSKECSASSLGTLGMSDGFHAKMSQFSRRKEVSAPSYAKSRLALITAVLCGSSSRRTMVLVATAEVSCDSEVDSLAGICCWSAGRFFAAWATRTEFLDHSSVLESLIFSASHA